MKIYKYIEMYVEEYLCENIKEYIKDRKYKNMYNVQKVYVDKQTFSINFQCFNLYLET